MFHENSSTKLHETPMQVEVKVCRAYGARRMLGNRCPSPGRAGLTFGGRPYGPRSPDRFLEKNISRTGLQNCRSSATSDFR